MAEFNSIKKILSALLICVVTVPVCLAVTATETSQQKRPGAWELLSKYTEQQAKVTAPRSKERVFHFPKERALGKLMVSDENARSEIRGFGYGLEGTKWESFCQAQGDVTIPAGNRVLLILDSWTWENPNNLSALKGLKPDDIYSLTLSNKWSPGKKPNDKCMPYVAHLTGLKTLNLWGANITNQGLKYINEIKSLERLHLPTRVDNSGMVHIGKLKSLKVLYFGGNNYVTNDGLAQLSNLKSLEELVLRSVLMTDKGLKHLSSLASLRHLTLGGNFTNNAFLYLKDVPSLRTLSIGIMEMGGGDPKSRPCLITRFNDEGMKNVSALKRLENLGAHWMEGITDKGVAHLKNMPSLKKLDIGHAHLTDRAILDLKQIPTLEWLHLPNYGLTDAGLKHIAVLQNLRYIWVGGRSDSPLTDESLRYVGKLKNLERLFIGGMGFSDKGMKHIAKLTSLKQLCIFNADQLTNKGMAELACLKSIRDLNISCPNVTISGLAQLNSLRDLTTLKVKQIVQDNSGLNIARLTNLEELSISIKATRRGRKLVLDEFRDEDVACLAKLTRLRLLWLIGISDAGLKHTAGLTNMERLGIGGPNLTNDGLSYLANMKKLNNLTITDGEFTDEGLHHLERLKSLQYLNITSANTFSSMALRRLRRNLPNLHTFNVMPQRRNN